jgi:hypothetical protein
MFNDHRVSRVIANSAYRIAGLSQHAAALRAPGCTEFAVRYEAAHEHALARLRQRFRIDAALSLPVKEAEVESLLAGWRRVSASEPG